MVRAHDSPALQKVIVLAKLGAPRADARRRAGKGRAQGAPAERAPVPITQVTIVDVEPLRGEAAAREWLDRIDVEREVEAGFAVLNRLLAAQRIAAADPYLHETAPAHALLLRAGFGGGEQVAEGRWLQARELHMPEASRWRRGRRAAILRSQERLARLLASPQSALLCEELALRARLDLDLGRLSLACSELDRALAAAVVELKDQPGKDMLGRLAELRELHPAVSEAAKLLHPPEEAAESIAHALRRLEAALRARAGALAWR